MAIQDLNRYGPVSEPPSGGLMRYRPLVQNQLLAGVVLLGLSGAAALGHQVLWTRRLTDLVGANAESCTRVLECFFVGLALGSAAAVVVLRKIKRPWRIIAAVELGVAILCLPILSLPAWTSWIWPALGPERLVGWQGWMIRFALSFVIVAPPAFLMGMTLPLVREAVRASEEQSANGSVWLYAAYTLGGTGGLVLVVGLALHRVGPTGTMALMISLNLLGAMMCFGWDLGGRSIDDPTRQSAGNPHTIDQVQLSWLSTSLAFFSGAGVLALEVLGLQLLNLKLPLAFFTPAAVLTCVVLLLGCSAVAVPGLRRLFQVVEDGLPFWLAAAGLMAAASPIFFLNLTAGSGAVFLHGSGIIRSLWRLAWVTCLTLGPAILFAGLVFPSLLLGQPGSNASGCGGRQLGKLLAINGLGGILGSEAVLRFLLPSVGVHQALGILGGFYSLFALGMLWASRRRSQDNLRLILPLVLVGATGWLIVSRLPDLPIFLRTTTCQIVEVRSGVEGSLAVVERPDLGRAMFLDNLYLLGSSRATPDLERQAHLPLLLHPAPKRVGFVGLGTGITAGGALRHQAVEAITIVELSQLVAKAANLHFGALNQGICRHPKARVYVEDAGPFFAAAKDRFDVIIGDLFTPWRPGEARLCSREQFQAAKAALLPRGVFCQWLQLSQLSEDNLERIVATFRQVFDPVYLFRNHFKTGSVPLALVGFKTGALDWDTVADRCRFERQHGRLRDPLCRQPEGLALLYLGTAEPDFPQKGGINTLRNLQVELNAGRHILTGNPSDYFYGDSDRWLQFLERQVKAREIRKDMPDSLRRLPRVGRLISQWEIAGERGDATANTLKEKIMAEMPNPILKDTDADQSFWAGHSFF